MFIFRSLLGLGATVAFLIFGQASHAAIITVTTTEDEVAVNGRCSLREAIRAADSDATVDACPAGSGADTILVPAGIYTLTLTDTLDTTVMGDYLRLSSDISIVGAGRDVTTIKGSRCPYGSLTCYGNLRLIQIAPTATVALTRMTLGENRYEDYPLARFERAIGGGILNDGRLSLIDSVITNTQAAFGGAIYNTGSLTVTSSILTLNAAVWSSKPFVYGSGGAVFSVGEQALILNSSITDNRAYDFGGGIVNGITSVMTIENTIIGSNTDSGIHNDGLLTIINSQVQSNTLSGIRSFGPLTVINTRIHGNTSYDLRPSDWSMRESQPACAGLYAGSQVTITGSAIYGNWAQPVNGGTDSRPGVGGGVCFFADATVKQSAIYANSAGIAAGIYVSHTAGSATTPTIDLENVTISLNAATGAGGGLHVEAGQVDMRYVTMAYNSAFLGPNLHVLSGVQVTVSNSLIAWGQNCTARGGVIVSGGNNLGSDASCTTLTATGDITNTDPLIGLLQTNWPGTLPTHALLPGSPAINAGSALAPEDDLRDQRGIPRQWGGPRSDIGAFEVFDPAFLPTLRLPLLMR
jgi:CSLREA domain-containing protein